MGMSPIIVDDNIGIAPFLQQGPTENGCEPSLCASRLIADRTTLQRRKAKARFGPLWK
jgi:hypothetical protein